MHNLLINVSHINSVNNFSNFLNCLTYLNHLKTLTILLPIPIISIWTLEDIPFFPNFYQEISKTEHIALRKENEMRTSILLGESLRSSSSFLALCMLLGEGFTPAPLGPCVVVIVISPLLAASLFRAEAADTTDSFKGDDCSGLSL